MKIPRWLVGLQLSRSCGGVGALIEISEKWVTPRFPSTLGYVVWSFTMTLVAVFVNHPRRPPDCGLDLCNQSRSPEDFQYPRERRPHGRNASPVESNTGAPA